MSPLPLPVRLAAGIVATAVEQARDLVTTASEQARDLPRLVIEFPVTAVSQALQTSMRLQQRVTELAIKGDLALGALRPVEESPSWATFDEDEGPPQQNGSVTALRPSRRLVPAVEEVQEEPVVEEAVPVETVEPPVTGPNALPGYDQLTIPQLRAKLRTLTLDDLRALLDWEQAHLDRPPFVTMLSNRISTVSEA